MEREFSGNLVVRALHFHLRGMDLIPGWGAKILYVVLPGQKKKSTDAEEEAPDCGKAGSHGLQNTEGTMTWVEVSLVSKKTRDTSHISQTLELNPKNQITATTPS